MATLDISPESVRATATSDLAQACEMARQLVEANPQEEEAAVVLHEVVGQFAREHSAIVAPIESVAPAVAEASRLLSQGKDEQAEIQLREHLSRHPTDTSAIRLMSQIAMSCGFPEDAKKILGRALDVDPESADSWSDLGKITFQAAVRADRFYEVEEAIRTFDEALIREPSHERSLSFKAAILIQLRRLSEGETCLRQLLAAYPANPYAWTNYGYLLKTIGRFGSAIAAYRTAFALDPTCGPAWWGLANLKRAPFFRHDLEAMEAVLKSPVLGESHIIEIRFALAKALDDQHDYGSAASQLIAANALRKQSLPHDSEAVTRSVEAATKIYTRGFFERRDDWGHRSAQPIFILGMPRSGSTLLEQILANHSQIEGTEELFIVQQLSGEIAKLNPELGASAIERLGRDDIAALGARYVHLATPTRRTERPHFTDKNPNNWRQLGLILAMLPRAKVIDIRRNPLDCCFANFAQHFRFGGSFTYSQSDVAHYYRDYVRLMRHFDEVLPGRVHRIIYEDLVENLDAEVRRLLNYLDLPFEESCLRFFESDRPVHTPSSEQVRQPINRSGIGRWRNYEPWIGELQEALGDSLDNWRD